MREVFFKPLHRVFGCGAADAAIIVIDDFPRIGEIMMLNVACIGSAIFGLFIGYIFAWSTRRNEPNGSDVAGLLGTILGGTILQMVDKLHCENGLALYLIGLAVGYVLYIFLLKMNWPAVKHAYDQHGLAAAPLFPFLVPREFSNDRPTEHPPQPPRQ